MIILSLMERRKFVSPDLHAPRHRVKTMDLLAYPEKDRYGFFTKLKKQHPELVKYTNREVAVLIEECNKLMAHDVATSWEGVMLPEGLGFVITGLCKLSEKTANNNIDYGDSNKQGIKIPYGNHHSNGYVAKVMYTNDIPWRRFTNHDLWAFKPCRNLQRAVAVEMIAGRSNQHKVFTRNFTVNSLFRKSKIQKPTWCTIKAEKARKQFIEQYDEFSFD